MKIKCDYCGNTYEDTLEKCPSCGGPNPSHKNDNRPKTIEELKIWYQERNLPAPEVTRFFIGTDYRQPKAFGIYKDDQGDFVVYKNKADGSRAIRYKGKGKKIELKTTFDPKNATNKEVTYKCSNKKIATIDKNGNVKGKTKGKVTITAITKDGKKTAKCTVIVK